LARAQVRRGDDHDAHLVGNRGPVVGADRPIHHAAHVIVVAKQIAAVEEAEFRDLLRHLEGGHRAHFEVATLQRRHLGALLEQGEAG
jgi:hypothetical protein